MFKQGIELDLCLAGVCLPKQPKLVLGVKGTTADFFVENAAYSNFLHSTFNVSSIDMESAEVFMVIFTVLLPEYYHPHCFLLLYSSGKPFIHQTRTNFKTPLFN